MIPHGPTASTDFLTALGVRMRTELERSPAAAAARPLLDAGGKRLRAQLVWLSARATSPTALAPDDDAVIRAAAAVELAHLSSLIHDDIVDGAETRRGAPTLHCSRGVRVAVDAGSALAHVASALVATLSDPARRAVRRAILALCRGQVRELTSAFAPLPLRSRLAIMLEKTGGLFEAAASVGALARESDRRHRAAIRRFARRFGVAFQIADDILDLTGDPAVLGRANGADIREGVSTLPILLADDPAGELRRCIDNVRDSFQPALVVRCITLIERGHGISRSARLADWWLERAMAALDALPDDPSRRELRDLAVTSIRRRVDGGSSRVDVPEASHAATRHLEGSVVAAAAAFTAKPPRVDPLVRSLEWICHGLSVATAHRLGGNVASAADFEDRLLRGSVWSAAAKHAARAVALARAIENDQRARESVAASVALADCLHCAAIALLCGEVDATEHYRLALRIHDLYLPAPTADCSAVSRVASHEMVAAP